MKERSILCRGSMVRAIIEGQKTQTRRVIKPQPKRDIIRAKDHPCVAFELGMEWVVDAARIIKCPYGQPGDRLWVRETWAADTLWDKTSPKNIPVGQRIWYGGTEYTTRPHSIRGHWRPSIHMPRWASRLTLEIVSVRVERVHDISDADAREEGAPVISFGNLKQAPMSLLGGKGFPILSSSHKYGFYELWDSINAKRGYGWDANPWVWVIEFKRVEQPR